jgi:NADPH:quinone reductase-like Zn-dependent oxidoreductase
MQLVNYAAWIPAEKAALEVATAPFPSHCGADEIIIKNRAVAVNPVDWKIQTSGGFGLKYPAILGEDVAGEVIEVGEDVDRKFLKRGDRVIAHALSLGEGSAYAGFQLYPRLKAATVAKIPDDLEFKHAVVLPLGISTAASGLYLKDTLGLEYPRLRKTGLGHGQVVLSSSTSTSFTSPPTSASAEHGLGSWTMVDVDVNKPKPKPVLLLWGGSSSVGSSVIQLAVASGYDVVTTASPANYSYVKSLGAVLVLDYHNPDIVPILVSLLKGQGRSVVGAYDAIGSVMTVGQCAAVLHALDNGGGTVASVGAAPDAGELPPNVKVSRISGEKIVSTEDGIVAKKVWQEYVSAALGEGCLKPAPEELVVGNGLYYVQGGLDRQKKGVSARKVVVTL